MTSYRMDPARSGFDLDRHLAGERIAGLQRDADRERLADRVTFGRVGRLRGRIGIALIALGSALASPGQTLVNGPERRP